MSHSVAVVGLGKVGLLYDLHDQSGETVLTHCRAFSESAEFSLVAGVDPEPAARRALGDAYSVPAYDSVKRMLEEIRPDIVVVSCPPRHQIPTIRQILTEYNPKLILCEKPFGIDGVDSNGVVGLARDNGVPLFVNYQRRADPSLTELRLSIPDEAEISSLACVVWYSTDLRGGASHFIDLITFFFPTFLEDFKNAGERLEISGSLDHPTIVSVRAGARSVVLIPWNRSQLNHYSLEIVGDFGRIRYDHDGLVELQRRVHGGPISLSGTRRRFATSPLHLQLDVARSIADFLRGSKVNLCTGARAVEVQAFFDLIESRLGGESGG